ncbi:peptidylprolyl isomerase [Mucilaginibacter auburnensis]|uniref:Peptidyl-prolyl cis-trans isomerase SurA n=1 Tax=Mucilaginibacter auburnensis TaxID=1457233 RepID=A0A2H9VPJ0_9SPHI|nr:peptidylprolyl isomerase [Mucilaginibacter auburnensis]PJJ80253.1 peptidyl-prolyl cis-trans isomerase SurA [Mucilaginibacter auburnensis]
MRKFALVVISLVLFTAAANAQKQVLDKIVAVVGSNIILKSDLDLQYSLYLSQGNPPNQAVKCNILQQIISQKLLNHQAVIDSIEVKSDEVDSEIDRRMRRSIQQAGGEANLEKFLNKSLVQYKDEMRGDIREAMLAERMRAKITEKLNTTPQDVKKFFDAIPKDSLPTFNKEVEVGQIVFEPKLTKEEKEDARKKAQDLLDRVKKGEDFGVLARFYSMDPGSAREGGDLGFGDRQSYVKEFTAWAFKLKTGEISPVFESDFGFHFLQVIERRGENVHTRHILITPKITDESVKRAEAKADSIYNILQENKGKGDFFSSAASVFSDDKESKFNGGMLLNPANVDTRTTFIPTNVLDPQIAVVIDTMKVGQVSKPQVYKDQQSGKVTYRLYYLKSVTDAHKANLEQDFPKLKSLTTANKMNRAMSEWFEKKRKENYIKIDKDYQQCPELQGWSTVTASIK